eukprot:g6137.t1
MPHEYVYNNSMVNYDPENDMIKQLQRARDVIASTLYSNKSSGLKIDKKLFKESAENADTNHSTSSNSNKNKTLLYLSKKPWSVLAKELDIQKKRIEAKLVDIEKDKTYQYTNLKTKDEQLKYVKQKFYQKIWSLCLCREEKVPDKKVINKNVSKIDEEKNVQIRLDTPRTYEIPTKAERHAKKLMPWELLNGELPQLRQMEEEDESNYEFVNLEFLKPLINGILKNDATDEENINIHVERRAVVYHIMKNIKAG